VTLLAGLAKDDKNGGLPGWLQTTGVIGLATHPAEHLARGIDDLVPVKIPSLRRLVKAEFTKRFATTAEDIGSESWRYQGTLGPSSVDVWIRYSAKMGRPQLAYQVRVKQGETTLTPPNLCFESVLGAGFGNRDYLTQDNAERSVDLLGELVEYVARLPERLPA
jgi:hypothetical protein